MKKKYKVRTGKETIEREYNYIPVRYIIAVLITLFEILAIISIVVACCYYIPYFYIAAWITEIFCVIKIIASDDNPDYKVPWLLFGPYIADCRIYAILPLLLTKTAKEIYTPS